MKKFFAVCLLVTLMSGVAWAAERPKFDISMTGGSIGGAGATIGEGIGEAIRRSFPGSNVAYEVGQEGTNVVVTSSGRVKLGMAHAPMVGMGIDGKGPFAGRDLTNLRGICVLYTEALQHFFVTEATGLKTLDEIKEKQYPLKLNLNVNDSFMEIVGREALRAYGITYDDINNWGGSVGFVSMGPSLELMRDGRLDAYSNVIQIPSSHIVDLATTSKLTMLPLSKEAQDMVNKELGTFSTVIPAGMYNFVNEDVPTVAATYILFTRDDLPDEEVYAILQSIYENFDYYKNIHASLRDVTLEIMKDTYPVPLHPGAQKFFDEHLK